MLLGDFMSIIVRSLISFGICFIAVLLIFLLFINKYRREEDDIKEQGELGYIISKFKLDMSKTSFKALKIVISFINSFIIAFTFTITINIKQKLFLKLCIAFVVMFILIYSLYELVGRIFKKIENKKS